MTTARRPDFFIVGAPKSGTTAMYEYLRHHPEVFMPTVKEPNYFGSDLERTRTPRLSLDEYLKLFANAGSARRVGEASVRYLHSRSAAREIAEFAPHARAIAMLRNPVDMIHAMHSELLFIGAEDIADLEEALGAESARKQGARIPPGANKPAALQYRESARYAEQLERYFDALGRERVHVIIYDDFQQDLAAAYRATLQFLEVDDSFMPELRVVNANKVARSRLVTRLVSNPPAILRAAARAAAPAATRKRLFRRLLALNARRTKRTPMDAALRMRLQEEFEPEVRRLEALLSLDLRAWQR